MPWRLNTPLLHFLNLGARILDQILRFLNGGAWKPSYCDCGHIEGLAHVGLFQVYTTSFPCHHSRHFEYIQEICCCFKQWDEAITSTIYASIASSKVIEAYFVHFWGFLSWNLWAKIAELTTSWYSISRAVGTNSLVDHGGCQWLAAINWSRSSRCTPTVCYIVQWWPFTTVWPPSHTTACCIPFVLLSLLRTILNCVSWVRVSVAALAVLQWTMWRVCSCCVMIRDAFDKAPVKQRDVDLLWPGWGGWVFMIWSCGIGEEDVNEKKWAVLRII
jgi:hypothetical protein